MTFFFKDTGSKGPTNDLDCRVIVNKVLTKSSLSPSCSSASDYFKENESFQANFFILLSSVAVVISEEEVRVLYLPAYNQLFSHKPEIPFVKATSSHVSGYPILFLLNAAGQVVVLSLPTLKSLLCCPLFKQSIELDDPVCQKISLSNHGLGMYLVYSSEIQKFTISAELAAELQECIGELFIPMDLPEPQKNSFFKGVSTLFVSQKESVDLDSIFADKSTGVPSNSGMRSVGRTILGPSANMEQVTSRNVTAGQAANLALQTLHERGEKLGATVDATERLKDTAVSLSQKTGKLVEKYEKKKWYNF
ncbi:unnamed protein product [Dracunculus medinensis]|uniref:V-SNARE coiled-coil homology domain-containing protein n=1 Tax=Dracunculus medinensis TaxID=318479 RepID=A0A3P7QA18_DRAME|nr:unnamed protein product [Dracunculus medinensis]